MKGTECQYLNHRLTNEEPENLGTHAMLLHKLCDLSQVPGTRVPYLKNRKIGPHYL